MHRVLHRVRQEDLPLHGNSHDFVGAEQGGVNLSAFLFDGPPGTGPKPHHHPYDEVIFIREERGRYVVDGREFEAGAGDVLVIKAGEVHSFRGVGDARLVSVDVHLSPTSVTKWAPHPGLTTQD